MKRSSFSLIEIIITLPLLALLMMSIFQNYSSLIALNQKQKEATLALQESHYCKQRLKKMFLSLDSESRKLTETENGVEFYYHNGVNQNPQVSNKVLARLELIDHILTLKVYKEVEEEFQKKRILIREEELLSNLEYIDYLWGYWKEEELQYLKKIEQEPPLALKINLPSKIFPTYFFEL